MKHERGIVAAAKPNWRLKKTLSRHVEFRPIENDDVKYAWAAYKRGNLAPMAGVFAQQGMSAEEFKTAFEAAILTRYHAAWTLFSETPKGFIPIGFVLAFHSHPDPMMSPFMIVGDIVWCPWATRRNKIESAVRFFSVIRKTIPMIDYAHGDINKKFFEMLCRHGVMRSVGTTYNIVHGEPTRIFETRVE